MRVSLRHPSAINLRPGRIGAAPYAPALPMLSAEGPRVILGGHQGSDGLAAPVQPGTRSLFGPRGVSCKRKGRSSSPIPASRLYLAICPVTDESQRNY